MAPLPPPQGMSEADYRTIEAAVTETVRGRWFLGEFARRNRTIEMKQLLEAMGRLEGMMSAKAQPALPPADPSIRLLMQRIKEIAAQLEGVSKEMRDAGVDPRFPEAVDLQARAVTGMMRGPGQTAALPVRPTLPPRLAGHEGAPVPVPSEDRPPVETTRAVAAEPSPAPIQPVVIPPSDPDLPPDLGAAPVDPRLAVLSALDNLPLAKKLALFS